MHVDRNTSANKKWYKKKFETGSILPKGHLIMQADIKTTLSSMVSKQIKKPKQEMASIFFEIG